MGWRESPTFRERKQFGQAFRNVLVRARENLSDFGTHHASYPAPLKVTVSVAGLDWDARLRWNAHDNNVPWMEFVPGPTIQAMQHKMLWPRAMTGE